MFLFNRPGPVFEEQTDGDILQHIMHPPRLKFDEEPASTPLCNTAWPSGSHDILSVVRAVSRDAKNQYQSRNRQRWALEKRFEVENGFRFVSQFDGSRAAGVHFVCLE